MSLRRLTFLLTISSAGLSALISAGCKKSPQPNSETAPSPLLADLVGCLSINGKVCELPENRTIKIAAPTDATIQKVTGAAIAKPDGGENKSKLVVVEVAQGATSITIRATLADGTHAQMIAPVATARKVAWLDDAKKARAKGEVDRAKQLAAAHATNANDPPVERALAKGLLARIALSQAHVDEAFHLFREAIELHRAAGRVSDEADDSFALAFALHQRSQRYTEARAAIDGAAKAIALYPEGRAREPYYRGTLAAETGDHRRALALLREAEALAHRFGMVRLERNARSALALEMQEMGRLRAAIPLLDTLRAELDLATQTKTDAPTPCERVEAANNRGWAALLVNEAEETTPSPSVAIDARKPLEEALAVSECTDAYARASAMANLARVAFANNDLTLAEQKLDEATKTAKEPRGTERLGWIELRGRILLARGKNQAALAAIDEGLALARASLLKGVSEWSLLTLRGEILDSLNRTKDAQAALEAAEDALDEAATLVPLGEGRGSFTGSRSRSARALVGLLVKQKQARAAAEAAQRAEGRVLSSIERSLKLETLAPTDRAKWEESVRAYRTARAAIDNEAANDWKLPADQLAKATTARASRERDLRAAFESAVSVLGKAPAKTSQLREAGVLELDIFPDLTGGFIAIANETTTRISSPPSPPSSPADIIAKVLNDEVLQKAQLVRIRAWGAWRSVDIHALPLSNGEPLISKIPVEYALGLHARPRSSSSSSTTTIHATSSLVVGDPSSNLPAAGDEAEAVAKAVPQPVTLLLRDRATSKAVTEKLREVDLLHYAGHGVFAGDEGFESALPLAAGGRLTVGDIFALDHAPYTVVLAGCEAAKSTGDAEGLGLAQAFLAAGSTHVLAPVRKVSDKSARVIATALWQSPPQMDFTTRARDAIVALRKEDAASDWSAFRVLVP